MEEIPKNMFQIWISNDKIPERWIASIESVQNHHQHWNYHLLKNDDADLFINEHYNHLSDLYLNFKYDVQKADLLRYLLMYTYGGIYLDLKYRCLKPIDDLSIKKGKEVYLMKSPLSNKIHTNSIIISKPKSRFWLHLIENIKISVSKGNFSKHFVIMNTTGPLTLQDTIKKHPKYIGRCDVVLCKCSFCHPNLCRTKGHLVSEGGGSWHGWDSKFLKFLYCYRIVIGIVILVIFIIVIIFLSR